MTARTFVAAVLVLAVTTAGTAWTIHDIARHGGCPTSGTPLAGTTCTGGTRP